MAKNKNNQSVWKNKFLKKSNFFEKLEIQLMLIKDFSRRY